MRRLLAPLLAASLALCAPRPAAGAEIYGVRFDDLLRLGDTTLSLNGVGLFRYALVFKVYAGALYLGAGARPRQVLEDVPKRLEVQYLRAFKGPEFGDAGDEVLARNVPAEVLTRIRERLARMNSYYDDVEPGDRSALTYVPGRGTELSINGRSKGWVEGADFAAAYFQIWFGREPLSESFRDQLLTPVR